MKFKILIGMLLGVLIGAVAFGPQVLQAVDSLTWEGIIPHIYTGSTGDEAINIAMTASTVGLDVSEESALTNTVDSVIDLTHTTTGSPANSIGAGITYSQETTASNVEKIMEVNAVVTDVTAASEDAKFSVELMAAGAAAAEKFAVGSTGVVTLVNGETIDNSTDGTVTYTTPIEAHTNSTSFTVTSPIAKVSGVLRVDEWAVYDYIKTTAQSYSLSSASKAGVVLQTAGEACTGHLMTDLLTTPGAGGVVTWGTGDTSDLTIDTQGAEKINGADTYVLDGTMETVTMINDGANWFVIGGYLE
jgi:hypothetical protein